MAKNKLQKTDGLGPLEIKKLRTAIRLVWHRSYARSLVVKRCIGSGGFSYCEKCNKRSPKIYIDHIEAVGEMNEGYIKRMFVASKYLQGWCKKCHDEKTKAERRLKKKTKTKKVETSDESW